MQYNTFKHRIFNCNVFKNTNHDFKVKKKKNATYNFEKTQNGFDDDHGVRRTRTANVSTAFTSLAFFLQCGYNFDRIGLRLDSAIVGQTLGWRELGGAMLPFVCRLGSYMQESYTT